MAAIFKNAYGKVANSNLTQVYAVSGASVKTVLIGVTIANTGASNITADLVITSSYSGASVDYYIVNDAPIAPGGSLVAIGTEQKVVMTFNNAVADALKVRSSSATGDIDVIVSMLENT
jgi:hypothetical protein